LSQDRMRIRLHGSREHSALPNLEPHSPADLLEPQPSRFDDNQWIEVTTIRLLRLNSPEQECPHRLLSPSSSQARCSPKGGRTCFAAARACPSPAPIRAPVTKAIRHSRAPAAARSIPSRPPSPEPR
jgi:hypothetical protein